LSPFLGGVLRPTSSHAVRRRWTAPPDLLDAKDVAQKGREKDSQRNSLKEAAGLTHLHLQIVMARRKGGAAGGVRQTGTEG